VLFQAKGKAYISNRIWREKMDAIVDLLRAIRSRYALAVNEGQIKTGSGYTGRQYYLIRDRQVAEWMDNTRAEIIFIFSDVCRESGVPTLVFPRPFNRSLRR
jgi:hypothetical protein